MPVGEGAGEEDADSTLGIVIRKGINGFNRVGLGGLGTLLVMFLSAKELNHIFILVDGKRIMHL